MSAEQYGATALLERPALPEVDFNRLGQLGLGIVEIGHQPIPPDFPDPEPTPEPEVWAGTKPEDPKPEEPPEPPTPTGPGSTEPGSQHPVYIGSTVPDQPRAGENGQPPAHDSRENQWNKKEGEDGTPGTVESPPDPGSNIEGLPKRSPGQTGHK